MKTPWSAAVSEALHGKPKTTVYEELRELTSDIEKSAQALISNHEAMCKTYESIIADKQNQIETLKSLRKTDEIRIRQLKEQLDGKEGTPCPSTSMSK